ncbi:MAG TPA: hypothetical protein VN041_18885, partial [Microbacterium sp.]|nr:hypothetical protein [Microbacterium sp.]
MADENDDKNTPTLDTTPAQPVVEEAPVAETDESVIAEPDAAPAADAEADAGSAADVSSTEATSDGESE